MPHHELLLIASKDDSALSRSVTGVATAGHGTYGHVARPGAEHCAALRTYHVKVLGPRLYILIEELPLLLPLHLPKYTSGVGFTAAFPHYLIAGNPFIIRSVPVPRYGAVDRRGGYRINRNW